jgi:hypothetical protein
MGYVRGLTEANMLIVACFQGIHAERHLCHMAHLSLVYR